MEGGGGGRSVVESHGGAQKLGGGSGVCRFAGSCICAAHARLCEGALRHSGEMAVTDVSGSYQREPAMNGGP